MGVHMVIWPKKCLLATVILSLILLISTTAVFAASEMQLATLKYTVNKVEVQRSGKGAWSEAKVPLPLYLGDRVRTLRNARATILFVDGSEIMLNQDTMLEVSSSYDTQKKGLINQVRIFLGEVFNKVSPQKDSSVQFKTPDAVATVRGTQFSIFTRPGQSLLPEDIPDYSFDTWSRLKTGYRTRLAVLEGLVDFFNQIGSVLVQAMQISESGWNVGPSTPTTVPIEDLHMEWVHELEQHMQAGNNGQGKQQGETNQGQQDGKQGEQAGKQGGQQSAKPSATTSLIPLVTTVKPVLAEPLTINRAGFSHLAPSPDNIVKWSGVLQPAVTWQFVVKNEKGEVVRTFSVNSAQVQVEWDGKDEKKAKVADGVYTATLVIDAAPGIVATTFTAPAVIIDTQAPQVQIKSPLAGNTLQQIVNIEASVAEANLTSWSMQIDETPPFASAVGNDNVAIAAAGKNTADNKTGGEILAMLDTTQISNGEHQLIITVSDIAGHKTTASVRVQVANIPIALPQGLGKLVTGMPDTAGYELMLLGKAVGVIMTTHGQVEVQRKGDGEWQVVKLSEALYAEDRLRTAAGAVAMVIFADNSLLAVNEGTMFEVEKRPVVTHPQGEVLTARLYMGEVFATINAEAARLEVAGPDATVSTNGATFLLTVQPQGTSVNVLNLAEIKMADWSEARQFNTHLVLLEGRALFVNRWGSVHIDQLQESIASGNQQPTKPALVKGQIKTDWLNKLGK